MNAFTEKHWQKLPLTEQKSFLIHLFYDIMNRNSNPPAFMNSQDWADLKAITLVTNLRKNPKKYYASLSIDLIACRYQMFGCRYVSVLYYYLKDCFSKIKVNNISLFETCSTDRLVMKFYFNMPAVYCWMSQLLEMSD